MKKILALYDLHVPFNIPLMPVWEFAQDFKPDVVVLGGDVHDWTSVCHWIADQSRALDGGTIKENYDEMKRVALLPLEQATGDAKKIYLTGNHEFWLHKACEINPNLRGLVELDRNLKNWKVYPLNVPYEASRHLYYLHGVYVNLYHARKHVESYQKSVLYGHTHDCQSHTHISPIDVKHVIKGQSCGCLCKMNPGYMKNKPNKWVNAFSVAYVEEKTGFFWDYIVYIIDGRFVWNGRTYK